MTSDERRNLVDLLIRHEGVRLTVYRDSFGIESIGVGRNLRDVGISYTEAMTLLDHDIDAAVVSVETLTWFEALNSVRQRVVLDLRFNLGLIGLLGFTQMIDAIKRGAFDEAADHLLDSQYARQLPARAQENAQLLRAGVDSEVPDGPSPAHEG